MKLLYFILIIWIIIGKFYISYLDYKINEEIKDFNPFKNKK